MNFRKLRIAWTVAWGVLAALLCLLAVRSYWSVTGISGNRAANYDVIATVDGEFYFLRSPDSKPDLKPLRTFPSPLTEADKEATRNNIKLNQRNFGFGWRHFVGMFGFDNGWQVSVSLWWPFLTVGVIAAVPWVFHRFSLRILLIATTFVAVGLGLVVWLAR